jgi:hypothetical protein
MVWSGLSDIKNSLSNERVTLMFNNGYCWGLSVITGFGYVHVGKMEEGRVWWTPMQGHHVSMGSVMITFASLHSQQHSPRFAIIRAAATQSLLIKSKFYALKREKAALNSSLNFTMWTQVHNIRLQNFICSGLLSYYLDIHTKGKNQYSGKGVVPEGTNDTVGDAGTVCRRTSWEERVASSWAHIDISFFYE